MPEKEVKSILLVEDEALIALAQKMALEECGYQITIVHSGEKAVEAIRKNPNFHLVLMDIGLGRGMNGPETAEIILKEKDIPIVFLSSHAEQEVVQQTEKTTFYGYVAKDSGITILNASINRAFRLFEKGKKYGIANRAYSDI